MRIARIGVQGYRNIARAAIPVSTDRILVLGKNGQGKSNLLEALGLVTALRSFRSAATSDLVSWHEREAHIRLSIEHDKVGFTDFWLRLNAGAKVLHLDQERVRRFADLVGRFPSIVISSHDILLLRGSPQMRRRFMDLVFSYADIDYFIAARRYYGSVAERNRLLKQNGSDAELSAFESIMSREASVLIARRSVDMAWLSSRLGEIYTGITGIDEEPSLVYMPDVALAAEGALLEFFRKGRARDRIVQATVKGPHRDDFTFEIFRRKAKDFGSEGQQRGLVVALRLAQFLWFRERCGTVPVLLADDILRDLDPERRARFWESIDHDCQIFATGTEVPQLLMKDDWEIWRVEEGSFTVN